MIYVAFGKAIIDAALAAANLRSDWRVALLFASYAVADLAAALIMLKVQK